MTGEGWKKSLHGPGAGYMNVDQELLEDTRRLQRHFRLEMLAVDYMVAGDGQRCQRMPQVAPRPGSLTHDYRVSYLDGEEGPQAEVEAARRDMVRLYRALRGRHALHRHHQGCEQPMPAVQRASVSRGLNL